VPDALPTPRPPAADAARAAAEIDDSAEFFK